MGVYKHPRALYTKLTHSLIYFVATVKLEENMYEIPCNENCGSYFLSISPASSYNWATRNELTCDNCAQRIADTVSGDNMRDER